MAHRHIRSSAAFHIDLSDAGRQPMLLPDRSVGVVFNGAIYNFLNLRAELERAGYSFKSRTDTEILLHGYSHWGIDGLVQRLRGMFAIGLWDERRKKLYLIRDRLGVKPLVYAVKDGKLAFASTVRALRDAGIAGDLDSQALAEFLEFGFVTDDHTIYRGVEKLRAGEILEWSAGRSANDFTGHCRRQNHPVPFPSTMPFSRQKGFLLEAVKLRLEADVPIGALLSGGVDSGVSSAGPLRNWAATSGRLQWALRTIRLTSRPMPEPLHVSSGFRTS